jgi:hypothetical protein
VSAVSGQSLAEKLAPLLAFVLTPGNRGEGGGNVVAIPSGEYRIRLELRFEALDYQRYTAVVEAPDGNRVWRGENLSLQATGAQMNSVQLTVPSNWLRPGLYKVRLSGAAPDGSTEVVAGYAFEVREK